MEYPYYGTYTTAPQPAFYSAPPIFIDSAPPPPPPPIVTASPFTKIEEQLQDLQRKLRRSLEFMQENQVLKPRQIVLIEPELEEASVKTLKPHDVFLGGNYTALREETEIKLVPKMENYEDTVPEYRQLPNGLWTQMDVKVQKSRPRVKRTPIPIAKLPKGTDIFEYTAETGTPISPELLDALRRASERAPEAIRAAFKRATSAEWGPVLPTPGTTTGQYVSSPDAGTYTNQPNLFSTGTFYKG